jgi:hypothetical protein
VEQTWYEDFALRCDERCCVPRALACAREPEGWLLVLQDLNVAGFSQRSSRLSEQELDGCLAWLAAFHATFVGVEPQGLWEQGTYWHLATRPDELAAVSDPALRAAAPELDRLMRAAQYRTLVHGDAKPENFCFAAPDTGGGVAALDFQYVGGGVGVQDVCYLLTSLDAAECERIAPRCLDRYFGHLQRELTLRRPQLNRAALEDEWRALFPVAWSDFHRFLAGWSPALADEDRYGRALFERWRRT